MDETTQNTLNKALETLKTIKKSRKITRTINVLENLIFQKNAPNFNENFAKKQIRILHDFLS